MTDSAFQHTYDQMPYPVLSYHQTHPDRLATIATLLGLDPAPVTHCRVLELGCASGGNLIPMAYGLPDSEFVGLDYSVYQIDEGQAAVAALGLKNISLRHVNILDVPAEWGQFDYIIAHGIYSWVPPVVQDKLLAICRQHLAPNGVAYISYNAQPGWHMLGMMREMMLYHTRHAPDLPAQVTQARAFLDFLAKAIPDDSSHGSFVHGYVDFILGSADRSGRSDAAMLHDELEIVNEPFYFYQFVEQAAGHGLQYLGEAEFRSMLPTNFPPPIAEALGKLAKSLIDLEQYMDFLRNRTFRQTLLCHQEIALSRTMTPERLPLFSAASRARPESEKPDIQTVSVEKFQAVDKAVLSTDHPVTKAAMLYLAEVWPQAVPFNTLLATARARLGPELATDLEVDAQVLGSNLLTAYGYSPNLLELHVHAPRLWLEAGERPLANPVARYQARHSTLVTNLRHERVSLDEFDRYLLIHLNGRRDRAELVDMLLAGPVAEGVLKLKETDPLTHEPEQVRSLLAGEVERKLLWLARAGLVVG